MVLPRFIEALKENPAYIKALPWALLAGIAFGCALFYQGLDNQNFGIITLTPFVMALGLTVIPGLRKGFPVPVNKLTIFIALYAAYVGLTSLWSPVPFHSLLFIHIFLILPVTFFALVMAPNARQIIYTCLGVFAFAMLLLVLWAFYQFIFLYETHGPRIHHPFLNPNDLGALFGLGMMIATGFFFQSTNRKFTAFALVMMFLLMLGVFLTQGRAILMALMICFGVMALMLRKIPDVLKFRAPLFFLLAIVLYVAVDAKAGLRITASLEDLMMGIKNASIGHRLMLWQSTLDMALDHFWAGVGLGNFHYIYPQYRNPAEGSDGFFTHLDPLQFWAEGGILLPILFYAVLVFALLRTIEVMKVAAVGSRERAVVAGTFCGLMAVMMHTHLSFDMYQPSLLWPMSVAFALWYIESEKVLADDRKFIRVEKKPVHLLICCVIGILMLSSSVWIARTTAGLWLMKTVRSEPDGGDPVIAQKRIDLAALVSPRNYAVPYEYQGRMNTYYLERSAQMPREEKMKLYEEGVAAFAKARKYNSYDAYERFYQAVLYERGFEMGLDPKGRETAITLLQELIADDPIMMEARMGLASIYEISGNPDAAFVVLQDGLKWPKPIKPISIDYFVKLMGYYERKGDATMYNYLAGEAESWRNRIAYKATLK